MEKYRTTEELANINIDILQINGINYAGVCFGLHKTKKKYIIGFFLNSTESDTRNFLLSKQELKNFIEENDLHFHNLYEKNNGAIKYADYRPCMQHLADTVKKSAKIDSCNGLKYKADVKNHEISYTQNLYTQNHDLLELQIQLDFDEEDNLYTLSTIINYTNKTSNQTEILLMNAISMPEEIPLFTCVENLLQNACTPQQLANARQRTKK